MEIEQNTVRDASDRLLAEVDGIIESLAHYVAALVAGAALELARCRS